MAQLLHLRLSRQFNTATPNPTSADADDDFGFSETSSFFQDAKNFDEKTGTDINKP